MAKLTISEAARQVPISRKTLYKNYIKTGKISIEQDSKGNPKIDSSELIRVFPELQGKNSKSTESNREIFQGNSVDKAVLEERIKGLEALLFERDRNLSVKDELLASKDALIAKQEQQLLLLGIDKKEPKKRRWWFTKK